jgi:phosphotransferase system HPr (HPr) family protein
MKTIPVVSQTLTVPCSHGLHLRVAARIVTLAKGFDSNIWLSGPDVTANAKSVLALLGLGAVRGMPLTLRAQGTDARQAVDAIAALFASEPQLCRSSAA